MQVPCTLHMNGGEEEYSYNRNSLYQKKVILTTKPMLEESIAQLCKNSSSKCLTMVDMGCSSGPNALLPLCQIIEIIDSMDMKPPNLLYFLNDLPGNDFNTLFRCFVPDFYRKLEKKKGAKFGDCFIAAMPGDFYGRLFPANSLYFVYSSYSLHWGSQVPEGLVSGSGTLLNKGNICLAESSSKIVHEAYEKQFEKDFTNFLRSRSVEMIVGGHMLLTINSRNDKIPYCNLIQFLGDSLKEMVGEGKIEESLFDTFNVTANFPCTEQVRNVIEKESSFRIKEIKEMELSWDVNIEDGNKELVFDTWERGKHVANYMRAILEPRVASHFGDAIVDDVFQRYLYKVVDCLEKGTGVLSYLVVSLIKI